MIFVCNLIKVIVYYPNSFDIRINIQNHLKPGKIYENIYQIPFIRKIGKKI